MKQYVNEYDEALDALTSGVLDTSDIGSYMGAIVGALKKQIPEKPLRRMFKKYENWCCPICQGNIKDGHGYQNAYCRKCGQRIDWDYGWDYVREMCL